MPDFTVTVGTNEAKIVQYIALQTGKTGRELIEGFIETWAHGQIEGFFLEKLRNKTTDELIALLGDII
jgi:hypothetical protein